jgi:hypothetical protein
LLTVHHIWVSALSWPGPGKSLDDSELLFVLQKIPLTLAGLQVGRQKREWRGQHQQQKMVVKSDRRPSEIGLDEKINSC